MAANCTIWLWSVSWLATSTSYPLVIIGSLYNLILFLINDIFTLSPPTYTHAQGEYLLDSDSALGKSTIRYFSASELPTSAPERFDILFAARFKWEADDIRTYVEDISFDTMHRDYLLLEHGRLIRGNEGKLWFCGKYKNKRGWFYLRVVIMIFIQISHLGLVCVVFCAEP